MKGAGDKVCCTFTTYNVLATLFGLLVVAVASWLAADKISFFTELKLHNTEEHGPLGEDFANVTVIDYGAFILIAIGAAIVVQSILGCVGTMMGCCGNRGARKFLIVYGVLVAIVVICEIVAAILVLYVFVDQIQTKTREFMEMTLQKDYILPGPGDGHANSVTLLWDKIMTSLHCCGVSGYGDFPAGVPASCCLDTAAPGANTTLAGACPDTPTAQMDTGCFSILFLGSVPAIASSLAVVALFQIAGVILSCCLARKVEDQREWYEMRSM